MHTMAPLTYRLVSGGSEPHVNPHHVLSPDARDAFLARLRAALLDCLNGRADLDEDALQLHIDPWDVDQTVTVEIQPHNGRGGSVWLRRPGVPARHCRSTRRSPPASP